MIKKKGFLVTVSCRYCDQPTLCTYTAEYEDPYNLNEKDIKQGDTVELRCIHNGEKMEMIVASIDEVVYNE